MVNVRLICAIGLLLTVAASAQQPPSQQGGNAFDRNASVDQDRAQNLDMQYAEVALELSNLELQRAIDINKQVPGTFSKVALEALNQSVMINQEQLANFKRGPKDRKALYLIAAEINAQAAETGYKRGLQINQINPGTFAPAELQRLKLTAELADIGLAKARSVDPRNAADFLQWQMDQLREDLYQLRNRVAQLSRLN
jgi:hypothetical protein